MIEVVEMSFLITVRVCAIVGCSIERTNAKIPSLLWLSDTRDVSWLDVKLATKPDSVSPLS